MSLAFSNRNSVDPADAPMPTLKANDTSASNWFCASATVTCARTAVSARAASAASRRRASSVPMVAGSLSRSSAQANSRSGAANSSAMTPSTSSLTQFRIGARPSASACVLRRLGGGAIHLRTKGCGEIEKA